VNQNRNEDNFVLVLHERLATWQPTSSSYRVALHGTGMRFLSMKVKKKKGQQRRCRARGPVRPIATTEAVRSRGGTPQILVPVQLHARTYTSATSDTDASSRPHGAINMRREDSACTARMVSSPRSRPARHSTGHGNHPSVPRRRWSQGRASGPAERHQAGPCAPNLPRPAVAPEKREGPGVRSGWDRRAPAATRPDHPSAPHRRPVTLVLCTYTCKGEVGACPVLMIDG
jgi:hypothetical protein